MNKKTILLIGIPNYSKPIIEKMNSMGFNALFFPSKPNEKALTKILGRFHFPFFASILKKYYKKCIESINSEVEYIIVLRGEYTPSSAIELMRKRWPSARIVLYMWDSIDSVRGIEHKWRFYDEVFTFDRKDYLNYSKQISFLPLFFYDNLIEHCSDNGILYNISFIGTCHEDRPFVIDSIFRETEKKGFRNYKYYYLPHLIVFWYNKLFNKYFKHIKKRDINFKLIGLKKMYLIYSKSECVVDVEAQNQSGLTMRTMEIIGLRKKLITTNSDIKNYDFYNDNNILIIDRKNPCIDYSFFDKPYLPLDEGIYYKYSLEHWIKTLLTRH